MGGAPAAALDKDGQVPRSARTQRAWPAAQRLHSWTQHVECYDFVMQARQVNPAVVSSLL